MNWPMFQRVEHRARRMNDMIERLDLDTIRLVRLRGGDAYSEARAKCLLCLSAEECRNWLKSEPQSAETPSFCPNLAVFESCRRADP